VFDKKRRELYFLLFILGVCAGIFFGINKVRASSPEGETSGGEQPASTYYDEFWQATEAVVSTAGGFAQFNPSTHNNTGTAARFRNTPGGWVADIFPKMVVTRWRVHGHIHFR
jgi:hypothetical protein